jgi:hypothetical protein
MKNYTEIYLNQPVVAGNRITYSWNENSLFPGRSFWIEYPDISEITASGYELIAPYLPVCIAFAAFGRVRIHLPVALQDRTLTSWVNVITGTAKVLFKRRYQLEFVNGQKMVTETTWRGNNTALLFGGGTESLLCLGKLRNNKVNPILVSFCGPSWRGSNEEENPHKFQLEKQISRDLGLTLINIRTSFRDLIRNKDKFWKPLLVSDVWNIVASSLFATFTFTFIFPIARQFNLQRVVAGNEKENNLSKHFYSFSTSATGKLSTLHNSFSYHSFLNDLWKTQVFKELITNHPELAKYQYSCLENSKTRWCHSCKKCLRNYLFYKIYNCDLSEIGMDEEKLLSNLSKILYLLSWGFAKTGGMGNQSYRIMQEEAERNNCYEAVEIIRKSFKKVLLKKVIILLGLKPIVTK